MKDPTFKLEGVVKASDDMMDFEGPLTLILQLLSKNKIEIKDIKIADLLEQYMAYLDEMKAMDLEIASEFVAMASHLVYIKARMLLATGDEDEPSELDKLIESLEILQNRDTYMRVKQVVAALDGMYTNGSGTYVKLPEPIPASKGYSYSHDSGDILKALLGVLSRDFVSSALENTSRFIMPSRIIYPVTDKENEILDILLQRGEKTFSQLIEMSKSRTEAVATFIAILELCRSGKITLYGENGETTITRSAEVEEDDGTAEN